MKLETIEKVNLLYNELQKGIQESYRETLRPLTEEEFHIWFDEDKLANTMGLPCYYRYFYQESIDSNPEERFAEVLVYPWTVKKVYDEKHIAYHWIRENEWKFIAVYDRDNRHEKPYVYSIDRFYDAGLYCNSSDNSMKEIKEYERNGKVSE